MVGEKSAPRKGLKKTAGEFRPSVSHRHPETARVCGIPTGF
jgi:hypothetical protein